MFTRQHYKAIAGIIKDGANSTGRDPHSQFVKGRESTQVYIAVNLADYFAIDNPRFNRDKFMAACGLE